MLKCILHLHAKGKEPVWEEVQNWFASDFPWSFTTKNGIRKLQNRMKSVMDLYELFGVVEKSKENIRYRKSSLNESMETVEDVSGNGVENFIKPENNDLKISEVAEKLLKILDLESEKIQMASLLLVLDQKRENSSLQLQAFDNIKEVSINASFFSFFFF